MRADSSDADPGEILLELVLKPDNLARLQAWQPTLEGLYQLTIHDGRLGRASLAFDSRVTGWVADLLRDLGEDDSVVRGS